MASPTAWTVALLAALLLGVGAALPALADDGEGNGDGQGNGQGKGKETEKEGERGEGDEGDGEGREREDEREGDDDDEGREKDDDEDDDDDGDEGKGRGHGRGHAKEKKGHGTDSEKPEAREASGGARVPRITLRQDVVAHGHDAAYTVAVRNDGQASAPAIAVEAVLPPGHWESGDPACTVLLGRLSCALGELAPGEARSVAVEGTFTGSSPFPAIAQAVTPLSA